MLMVFSNHVTKTEKLRLNEQKQASDRPHAAQFLHADNFI